MDAEILTKSIHRLGIWYTDDQLRRNKGYVEVHDPIGLENFLNSCRSQAKTRDSKRNVETEVRQHRSKRVWNCESYFSLLVVVRYKMKLQMLTYVHNPIIDCHVCNPTCCCCRVKFWADRIFGYAAIFHI